MRKNILIIWLGLLIFCHAASAELMVNGDGTVTDTETGLMWQQDETGWMDWESALSYCENLELAGYDDWRLPNINELQSLVDYSTKNPAIDTYAFPNATSSIYWSSTTYSIHIGHTGDASIVDFGSGLVYGLYKSFNQYVRAVRIGQ